MQENNDTNYKLHDHVLLLYESQDQRLQNLAHFFGDGMKGGELCIFVTPDPAEKVIEDFISLGFDAIRAVSEGFLQISDMEKTYLPNGKFIPNDMLTNVKTFIRNSRVNTYGGLRTAGEMSWLIDHTSAVKAAHTYEVMVTPVSNSHPDFIGMCLYPHATTPSKALKVARETHPSIIKDGAILKNKAYS